MVINTKSIIIITRQDGFIVVAKLKITNPTSSIKRQNPTLHFSSSKFPLGPIIWNTENSAPWISTSEKFPQVCGFHLSRTCPLAEALDSICPPLICLWWSSVGVVKGCGFRLSRMAVTANRAMRARIHQLLAREDCSSPPETVLFSSPCRGLFWLTDSSYLNRLLSLTSAAGLVMLLVNQYFWQGLNHLSPRKLYLPRWQERRPPPEDGRQSHFFYDPLWPLISIDANIAIVSDIDWRPNCTKYATLPFKSKESNHPDTKATKNIKASKKKAVVDPLQAMQ